MAIWGKLLALNPLIGLSEYQVYCDLKLVLNIVQDTNPLILLEGYH
jgi:hypothetical protein